MQKIIKRKNADRLVESLHEFTKEQMISMLAKHAAKSKQIRKDTLNFVDANLGQFREINERDIKEAKYQGLWGEAYKIISDFNEYGGGPDEDEEIAYNNFEEIVKLFKNGKLDKD